MFSGQGTWGSPSEPSGRKNSIGMAAELRFEEELKKLQTGGQIASFYRRD
jgi:hypothetical protein